MRLRENPAKKWANVQCHNRDRSVTVHTRLAGKDLMLGILRAMKCCVSAFTVRIWSSLAQRERALH
jgi:hypothetical protein